MPTDFTHWLRNAGTTTLNQNLVAPLTQHKRLQWWKGSEQSQSKNRRCLRLWHSGQYRCLELTIVDSPYTNKNAWSKLPLMHTTGGEWPLHIFYTKSVYSSSFQMILEKFCLKYMTKNTDRHNFESSWEKRHGSLVLRRSWVKHQTKDKFRTTKI